MRALVDKYAAKLAAQGLTEPGEPLVGGLDAELVWNREDPRAEVLAGVFDRLSINSLVCARPARPLGAMVDFLAARHPESIRPSDTETRTFLHDIPVVPEFTAEAVAQGLRQRKAVIVPGHGIVASGTVTPEQGFVYFSSVCFACFVHFFAEFLRLVRTEGPDDEYRAVFARVRNGLAPLRTAQPDLARGPFHTPDQAMGAMVEAGRAVVDYGLVDSFFGNISYRLEDTVYISQTGSSLDELAGCIDPCPMDGSSTAGLTASSELTAHEDVYRRTDRLAVLHGHPRFSVIMSMHCEKPDCELKGLCHVKCAEKRDVNGVPIVPGEVGTGPTGLCHTLPPALERCPAALVHGHGLFTVGALDFRDAFAALLDTERMCRERYFELVAEHEH